MSRLPTISEVDRELARRELSDFVPWVSPKFSRPEHLGKLVRRMTGVVVDGDVVKLVCAAPPQHAKTETIVRFIAWALWLKPTLRISYTTFSASRARRIARKVRDLLDKLGVQLSSRLVLALETPEGGCLLSCGIRGPLNGEGLDIAIIDDAYKNRVEAESAATNDAAWEWVEDVWLNRGHAKTSYLVFGTRWTPNDLSGRLLKSNDGWEWLAFPALSEAGESLWPERWTPEQLRKKRSKMSVLSWESLWMQNPRPRGNALFTGSPGTYTELPKVYRAAFGVDLAYRVKTSADSSAVVKILEDGQGFMYVAHVDKRQVSVRRMKKICRRLHKAERAAPWWWYAATSELGAADLFNEKPYPVPLEAQLANKQSGDKRVRALRFADAWNEGKVLVPKAAPWLDDFLANLYDFTGAEGGTDDDVDAAVAAFDALRSGVGDEPVLPTDEAVASRAKQQWGLDA